MPIIIVPARAGSKGLPGKHLLKLGGKTLIEYTFDVCDKLELQTCLLTDEEKIKNVSKKYPHIDSSYSRPDSLSQDDSDLVDLIEDYFLQAGIDENMDIILLQPTNPFRSYQEIKEAYNFFRNGQLTSLAFYSEPLSEPNDCFEVSENKFLLEKYKSGRQFKPRLKFISGECYIVKFSVLKRSRSFVTSDTFAWKSKNWKGGIDIDYQYQFDLAKHIQNGE